VSPLIAASFRFASLCGLAGVVATLGCIKQPTAEASRPGDVTTSRALVGLPPQIPFAARLSLRRLRGTALGEALPGLVHETPLADDYGKWVRVCKTPPLEAFNDVVVGIGSDEFLVAAELAMPADEAMRCVRDTFGGHEAQFQERGAIRIDPKQPAAKQQKPTKPLFAVATGTLLLVGDEGSVAEALNQSGPPSGPLTSCLDLGADAVVTACGTPPAIAAKGLELAGRSSSGELAVRASLEFKDAAAAAQFRDRIVAAQKSAEHEAKFVREALDTIRATTESATTTVRFGTSGDGVAQAGYLVALATGMRKGLWEQEAKALSQEARINVAALANALVKLAHEKPHARGPVFPPAPPAVPASVPHAAAHAPTDDEFSHPTWTALGFAPKEPFRYQYEIVVSHDRRRATVRARGDLDGNGRNSVFEVVVDARPSGATASPIKVIEETE
jgi:hypothetical protein